jgi:acetyltransferase EpsM
VIIAIGDNRIRTQLADALRDGFVRFANVVDPSAIIMPDAVLGVGIFVGPQAVVHSGAKIGDHVVVNTGAIIEHDCIVAAGAAVCPGVRMGGRVIMEKNCFIGTGATLAPRVVIGEKAIVGAGAVVTRNVPGACIAYGCPARAIREATEEDWARLF